MSLTAARNAGSLDFEGFANPLILRTNCTDAARISASVTAAFSRHAMLAGRLLDSSSAIVRCSPKCSIHRSTIHVGWE